MFTCVCVHKDKQNDPGENCHSLPLIFLFCVTNVALKMFQ